jgi:putative peptidoglycan lipid II flippase
MNDLFRNVARVASNTFLSRLLGFARDVILAHLFGAGMAADAFFVAQRIPNLFRRLFGEGAFSQAFVPVLNEYVREREAQETKDFLADVFGWLSLVLLAITIIGILGASVLVYLLAPGFAGDPNKFHLAVSLTQITFPYLFLISLVALSGGILNTFGHFQVPAFTPVFLNLAIILSALFWAPHLAQPVYAVAWGMLIGGVVQLLFQIPALRKIGQLHWPRFRRRDPGVARVLRLLGPAAFGASAAQVNLFLNTVLASLVGANVVSYLYYSDRLVEFPLGVFGVALGTVVLPTLSRLKEEGIFAQTLDWALRWTWLIGLPATVGLLLLGHPLLVTLFRYGAYSAHDAAESFRSLFGYGLGIVPIIAARVLAPAFYARQDTKTPMRFAMISVVVNIVCSLILAWPLQQLGLSLATTMAAVVNLLLLYWRLHKDKIYSPQPGWGVFLGKTILAALVLGVALYFLRGSSASWLRWSAEMRIFHLMFLVLGSVALYFFLLRVFGVPELKSLWRR